MQRECARKAVNNDKHSEDIINSSSIMKVYTSSLYTNLVELVVSCVIVDVGFLLFMLSCWYQY